jgi:hypothetical protein
MIRRLLAFLSFLALVPGRKIVVVDAHGCLWRGRVVTRGIAWVGLTLDENVEPVRDRLSCGFRTNGGTAVRSLADEGLSWCRGWSGPEVDALRVAGALL